MEKFIKLASSILSTQGISGPLKPKLIMLLALLAQRSQGQMVDILDSEAFSEAEVTKVTKLTAILVSANTSESNYRTVVSYFLRSQGVSDADKLKAYALVDELDKNIKAGTEASLFDEKGVLEEAVDSSKTTFMPERREQMTDSLRTGTNILMYLEGAFSGNDSLKNSMKDRIEKGRRLKSDLNKANDKDMLDQVSKKLSEYYADAKQALNAAWK